MSAEIAGREREQKGGAVGDGQGGNLSDKARQAGKFKRFAHLRAGEKHGQEWDGGRVGELLLWGLLLFVPWPFGSVGTGSEWVISLMVAGLGACLIKQMLFERKALRWSAALWPLGLLLGLAWMATVPMPVTWVEFIAPQNVNLRHELLSHLPLGGNDRTTLAIYPFAVRRMMRLMLGSGIVLLSVLNFCRTPKQIKRMLVALVLSGGAVAVEALLQDATSDGLIYWAIPAPVKSTSGPFVNYNNFCQYMNLTIGACLGLLLTVSWGTPGGRKKVGAGWKVEASPLFAVVTGVLVASGLCVLLSTSRGGVLAMLGAGLATGCLMIVVRADGKAVRVAALASLAMVLALIAWGLENFMGRMATLSDLESASGMRWQVFQDVAGFVPRFGVWGIGLGNHEMVYPMFSGLNTWRNAQFVENEYLQLIEEMGVVGLSLGVLFLAGIVWNVFVILRRRRSGLAMAVVGLAYGLVAICLGSVTDFGQRIASISCVTAVTFGLILAIRRLEDEAAAPADDVQTRRALPAWRAPVFSGAMLLVCVWMVWGSTHSAAAGVHWQQAAAIEKSLVRQNWVGSDEDYNQLIEASHAAISWEPENVEYRCWGSIYRWHEGLRNSAWDKMSERERMRLFTELLAEFRKGESACPTYGLNYAMAGQISFLGLQDPVGRTEIQRAYRLAPTHPAVCFVAGRMFAGDGQWEEAREAFCRAIKLRYPKEEVLAVYLKDIKRPDLAAEVFAEDWAGLAEIERAINADPQQADLAERIRLQSQAVLSAAAQKTDAPVQTVVAMADLMQRQGNLNEAITYYRRAIDGNYASTDAHLGLARSLAQKGDWPHARAEADICLRLKPEMAAAKQLLSDLAVPGNQVPPGDSQTGVSRDKPGAAVGS